MYQSSSRPLSPSITPYAEDSRPGHEPQMLCQPPGSDIASYGRVGRGRAISRWALRDYGPVGRHLDTAVAAGGVGATNATTNGFDNLDLGAGGTDATNGTRSGVSEVVDATIFRQKCLNLKRYVSIM